LSTQARFVQSAETSYIFSDIIPSTLRAAIVHMTIAGRLQLLQ
jgi:hypothetical protein